MISAELQREHLLDGMTDAQLAEVAELKQVIDTLGRTDWSNCTGEVCIQHHALSETYSLTVNGRVVDTAPTWDHDDGTHRTWRFLRHHDALKKWVGSE